MSKNILSAALCVFCVAAALSAGPLSAADRPNVVLIMTDDQGYGDLGCHGNGMIETPRIDDFYKQAIRLTDFHVDPTCSESRAALMTGRYSSRTGVWHTIMGRSLLRADETTIADHFRAAGYRTGVFGKWHLGDNYPFRPSDRGFDEVLVHGGGGVTQTPDYWGNDYFDDHYRRNGQWKPQEGYCTDVFFSAALDFIEANQKRPFFCYIPTNAAHGPFNVAKKYSEPYEKKGVGQPMANFYGMISNIDENVGRLLDKLDEWKLDNDTIVIFMTDNGTAAGVGRGGANWKGHNAGMRATKGSHYEGGHRVPCLIRWKGQWKGGRDVNQLAAHFDLLPTLAEVCGVDTGDVKLDGVSLKPLLQNDAADWPERTLCVHSQRVEQPQKWRKCSVMRSPWRLVDGKELYNLADDPGQRNNVAGDHPKLVEELRGEYEQWWKSISTRFDEYCRIKLGAKQENPTTLTGHDWHSSRGVPWNQGHIRSGLVGNGYWAVDVAEAGKYEIALRRWPEVVDTPAGMVSGRVKVGEVEQTAKVDPQAQEAVLHVQLAKGPQLLQTWLTNEKGVVRGAYFVRVKRIDQAE